MFKCVSTPTAEAASSMMGAWAPGKHCCFMEKRFERKQHENMVCFFADGGTDEGKPDFPCPNPTHAIAGIKRSSHSAVVPLGVYAARVRRLHQRCPRDKRRPRGTRSAQLPRLSPPTPTPITFHTPAILGALGTSNLLSCV